MLIGQQGIIKDVYLKSQSLERAVHVITYFLGSTISNITDEHILSRTEFLTPLKSKSKSQLFSFAYDLKIRSVFFTQMINTHFFVRREGKGNHGPHEI